MNWKWNRIRGEWNGIEFFIIYWFQKVFAGRKFALYTSTAGQPQHEVFNCMRGHFGDTVTAGVKEADKPIAHQSEICEECVGNKWTAKVFLNFPIIHWLPPDLNISSSSLTGNANESKIGGHLCPFLTFYTYTYTYMEFLKENQIKCMEVDDVIISSASSKFIILPYRFDIKIIWIEFGIFCG